MEERSLPKTKEKKESTPGIVYLNYIPTGLTVAKTREILSDFGDIGRMYFEPIKKLDSKSRPTHRFREGWIEFKRKKDAKRVAEVLNAKPVGGKRRAPYHDCLWNIKYLNRYRWTHLSERLTYEKAVKDQRLRTEIAKAKREASYYAKVLEMSIRRKKKRKVGEVLEENPSRIKLRKTDKEIREEKPQPAPNDTADRSLLMSIFSKE
ncbi:activator of basal transcription 1 [Galendromus occidentalis]|uniref:Activator of basal transcription 1 n=1 Tax=Galendromus occidentalis TaxID=34638 RepID=A0AAJ7L8B0_9ACAR|nr:activator of basal transcription 1 [Galendromus occidentalis]